MDTQANLRSTLRHPSAFLPVTMSLLAIAVVITHIVFFGTARQPDEGTAAHLWQLLMAGQLPIVGFFAIRWLPWGDLEAAGSECWESRGIEALAQGNFLHWKSWMRRRRLRRGG